MQTTHTQKKRHSVLHKKTAYLTTKKTTAYLLPRLQKKKKKRLSMYTHKKNGLSLAIVKRNGLSLTKCVYTRKRIPVDNISDHFQKIYFGIMFLCLKDIAPTNG